MASKVQLRRDTAANWASANPVLSAGEQALETDTGLTKVGDGTTAYTSLKYLSVIRRNTYAAWAAANPTLPAGEQALETDTGLTKIGNGTTAYTSQPYQLLNTYRLTGNGSAIGSTSATDYFTSAAFTMAAGGIYEIEWDLYFTKTTTNPVVFTVTTGQTPVNVVAHYVGTPTGGIGTVGSAVTAAAVGGTTTTTALPTTGSLTTGVNHHFVVKALVEGNATTAGIVKLQFTCTTSGTITPLRGSNYTVRQLPAANIGAFA